MESSPVHASQGCRCHTHRHDTPRHPSQPGCGVSLQGFFNWPPVRFWLGALFGAWVKKRKGMGGEERFQCNVKRMRPWKSHSPKMDGKDREGKSSEHGGDNGAGSPWLQDLMKTGHQSIHQRSQVRGRNAETGNKGACRAEVPPNLPSRVRRQNGPPPALPMPRWAICILECVF
jgi:hypothetical protein